MGAATLETEVKERLMNSDEEFKRLVTQHHDYDEKLEQLSNRHYLSETEQLEEVTLKKKKLLLKDQIHAMITRYIRENGLDDRV